MDCYKDMADVERAFLAFMDKVPFYGAVTACIDDPLLKSTAAGAAAGDHLWDGGGGGLSA